MDLEEGQWVLDPVLSRTKAAFLRFIHETSAYETHAHICIIVQVHKLHGTMRIMLWWLRHCYSITAVAEVSVELSE